MNNELKSIIRSLENINSGEPWYGKPVYEILQETDPQKAFLKPNEQTHSLIELLYHMLTWAEFTLNRIKKLDDMDMTAFDKLDWREIDPKIHGWEEGLSAFIATNQQILAHLETKDDSFLEEKVDYRNYNFRFLLNGYLQHNIYHTAQVAYINKLL